MKKILIIDDDSSIRENVNDMLSLNGYKIVEAENGNEGLVKAITEKPDLIISDVMMPQLTGFQLMEYLRKNEELSQIPVIFLTGQTLPEHFRTGLKLGATDYIIKPFQMKELLLSIKNQFDKIEKQKQLVDDNFKLIFENPFNGVFYYRNNKFVKTNNKVLELFHYSLAELNQIDLHKVFLGNAEQSIEKLCNCYNGITNEIKVKALILTKNKEAVEVEIFAKQLKVGSEEGIIGNIIEIEKTNHESNNNLEIKELVEYFNATNNSELAAEIQNASNIIGKQAHVEMENIKDDVSLSVRELEILQLICEGYTNTEIADKLFISSRTADNHRANMIAKIGTKNTASLVAFAIKNKLVTI